MTRMQADNPASPTATASELVLLEAVRRRDRRAFAELYRLYHPRLHGYLRRMLANAATAEEVLDDVMFVVWKDARKFRGDAAVSSWIFGIAYRQAMTALRREGRYQAGLDRGADAEAVPASAAQDSELIRTALKELSADHRQVVELTYFCGFSYREIAIIARCPVNTVKTRMFHARRRLKYLLPLLAGTDKEQNRDQG
ncbi:MAG: sigma-70 family RNA polymerase sigma factor [Gammaproteobacteria bacterium]|nr:sigma-70 family RNA polymerase sigma factor [Gammaproteobacteria bacterium]